MKKIFIILLVCLCLLGCKSKEEKGVIEPSSKVAFNSLEANPFVKYNEEIFFWKLNDKSRENIAVFSEYKDQIPNENELIKMDKNGKQEVIYRGRGSGDIIIKNDKIYTSYATSDSKRMIFSLDLNGKNQKELGNGIIKYASDSKIYGIDNEYNWDNNEIISIDLKNDEYKSEVKEDSEIDLIYATGDIIYYGTRGEYEYKINSINKGNKKDIAIIKDKDFELSESVTRIRHEKTSVIGNDLIVYVAYRDGSANSVQDIVKVTINNDNEVKKNKIPLEKEEANGILEPLVYWQYEHDPNEKYTLTYHSEKEQKSIITREEFKDRYKITIDDEHCLNIYTSSHLDNTIYFIADYGVHEESHDIGWRYAYKRNKTIYFKYDTTTQTLDKIYEF